MKAMKCITRTISGIFDTRFYLLVALCFGMLWPIDAQPEEGNELKKEIKNDSTAAEEEATGEKKELRMTFETFVINSDIKLQARVRSKVGAKFQNTPGVEISFYKESISPDNLIGKGVSNHKGEAFELIPAEKAAGSATYYAAVIENPKFEDVEESVSVSPSKVSMELEVEDSVRIVKIFVGYPDESGEIIPLAEAECNIYVQRLFGLLPIGETEITDEEGNISFEFPDGIKGDLSGNLKVIAKIADHEVIGNVEVSKTIAWGIPTLANDFYKQRQLWSARANSPLALIFVANVIILGIWGAIAFIFFEIYRINKLGRAN